MGRRRAVPHRSTGYSSTTTCESAHSIDLAWLRQVLISNFGRFGVKGGHDTGGSAWRNHSSAAAVQPGRDPRDLILNIRDELRKLDETIAIAVAILDRVKHRPREDAMPFVTLESRLSLGCRRQYRPSRGFATNRRL